jgi:hypothetical protein
VQIDMAFGTRLTETNPIRDEIHREPCVLQGFLTCLNCQLPLNSTRVALNSTSESSFALDLVQVLTRSPGDTRDAADDL